MTDFIVCNINDLLLIFFGLVFLWIGIDISTSVGGFLVAVGSFIAGWGIGGLIISAFGA